VFGVAGKTDRTLDGLAQLPYFTYTLNNKSVKCVDHLTETLSALADPTRRAILARLATGEATVNELAKPFDISLPAISRHLKVLERAGLISRGREAQWRPCRLEAAPLAELAGWVERYRKFWDKSFDRMDAYLAELQRGNPDAKQ
jgi:DNA-binding transcriptional ArsR family regulator